MVSQQMLSDTESHHQRRGMVQSQLAHLKKLNLSSLTRRLVSEDGFPDAQEALRCIEEYKRFLQLVAVFPDVPLVPPKDVWLIWHRHMLDTSQYIADCGHMFALSSEPSSSGFRQSAYLHHVPQNDDTGGIGSSAHAEHYEKTVELYWSLFGDSKTTGQDNVSSNSPEQDTESDCEYSEMLWTLKGSRGAGHSLIAPLCLPDASVALPTVPISMSRAESRVVHSNHSDSNSTSQKERSFLSLVDAQLQDLLPALLPALLRDHSTELPSEAHIVPAMSEYKRYLALLLGKVARKYLAVESEARAGVAPPPLPPPSGQLVPSRLVDLIWHCHIMDSQRYARDCAALLAATGVGVVGFKRGRRVCGGDDEDVGESDDGGVVGAIAGLDGGAGAGLGYYSTLSSHAYLHHSPMYSKPAEWHESGFQYTRDQYEKAYGTPPPVDQWAIRGESGGCSGGGPTPGPHFERRYLDREEFPWYYWLLLPCAPCSPWCRTHCMRCCVCCGGRELEVAWWGDTVEDISTSPPSRIVRYRAASIRDACLMVCGSSANKLVPGVLEATPPCGCCPCSPPRFEPATDVEAGARVFLRFTPLNPMPIYYWCIPPMFPCSRWQTFLCGTATRWGCCAAREFQVSWYTGVYDHWGSCELPQDAWAAGVRQPVRMERFRAASLMDAFLVGVGGISMSRDRPGEVTARRPRFPTPFLCLLPVICPWTLRTPRFERIEGGGVGGGIAVAVGNGSSGGGAPEAEEVRERKGVVVVP